MLNDSFRLISRNEYFDLLSKYNLFNQFIIDNEDLPFYSGIYIKYMIYECDDMMLDPIIIKSNLGCTEVNYTNILDHSESSELRNIISSMIHKDKRIPSITIDDLTNYINDLNTKVGKIPSFNINIDEASFIEFKDALYDFLSMYMNKTKILTILGGRSIHLITKDARLVIYDNRSSIPEYSRIDINKVAYNLPNLIESIKIINKYYDKQK